MILWLRPEYILALFTSLCYCSSSVFAKSYEKFLCATEEGLHQISCPDEQALLTDISIKKVYRRTQMCQPDDHSEYLIHCQGSMDGSICEGNQTCSIEISSRNYIQCAGKTYLPTYFFVKYSCTQTYTMCIDKSPIRNTLYGYIVSPGYPHPMADNLKCSINIEADSSMYFELSPIEVQLQETTKCRSEHIDIFGYDSSNDDGTNNVLSNTLWKSYYTWCSADESSYHPKANGRYLIPANSLYISLLTGVSRKFRLFKIRYKIIPSKLRSQYNADGFVLSSNDEERIATVIFTSTVPTSSNISALKSSETKHLNETTVKRSFRKEILIGIIGGGGALLLLVIITIVLVIFLRRRRSSRNPPKKSSSNSGMTNVVKSADKAPLLEPTTNNGAGPIKRKLVPERTVQISDVTTSRFKSNETTTKPTENSSTKLPLTAADSGIYGADLTEEGISTLKSTPTPTPTPTANNETCKSTRSSIGADVLSSAKIEQDDQTIQSAYPSLIDATASENEGTICPTTSQSRRSSARTPVEIDAADSTPNAIPFNPLHVILKKDANKYYTTEYI